MKKTPYLVFGIITALILTSIYVSQSKIRKLFDTRYDVKVTVALPNGYKLNNLAPSVVTFYFYDSQQSPLEIAKEERALSSTKLTENIVGPKEARLIVAEAKIFYCGIAPGSRCFIDLQKKEYLVTNFENNSDLAKNSNATPVTAQFTFTVKEPKE
jgi:hypothetical protein